MQCEGLRHNDQINKCLESVEQYSYNHSCPLWKSKIMEDTRPHLHTCQACIPHVISSLCYWNIRTLHSTTGIVAPCLSQWVISKNNKPLWHTHKKVWTLTDMQRCSIWIRSVPILIFHDLNLLDNKPQIHHFKSMHFISLDLLSSYIKYINPSRTLNVFHCMLTITIACKV